MRRIFKTIEDHLTECTTLEKGVWVHLQSPTKEEVDGLTTRFNLDPTFLPAALDEEESARIDYDSDKQQTLIIVDIPYVDTEGTGYVYSTIPLGIVLCDEVIITVCTRDTPIINDFTEERIRNFWTFKRTRFILQILQRNAGRFLSYLKQIDKTSQHIQEKLEHTSRNQELLQMMKLEKSLVYFNTSLKGNALVMERLMRQDILKRYPEDTDLLEYTRQLGKIRREHAVFAEGAIEFLVLEDQVVGFSRYDLETGGSVIVLLNRWGETAMVSLRDKCFDRYAFSTVISGICDGDAIILPGNSYAVISAVRRKTTETAE